MTYAGAIIGGSPEYGETLSIIANPATGDAAGEIAITDAAACERAIAGRC